MNNLDKSNSNYLLHSHFIHNFIRVFDSASVGMAVCDSESKFFYANNSLQSFLEYSLEELREFKIFHIIHPDELRKIRHEINRICNNKSKYFQIETRFITKTERVSWGQVWVFVDWEESRETRFFSVLIQDINERKEAEERVCYSEQKYRDIVESFPLTIFETDSNGDVTYFNSHSFRTFGYSSSFNMRELNISELVVPEERTQVRQSFLRLLGGENLDVAEYHALRCDGSTFPAIVYAIPIRIEGSIVGMRGVLLDITDWKRTEEERRRLRNNLRQAEKMEFIGQFASGVAHDFKNQLHAILYYAELVRNKSKGESELARYTKGIMTGAQRAAELTEQLLAFSRDRQHQRLPVNLNDVVTDLLSVLERSIDQRITLRSELCAKAPIVEGDPAQLQKALHILAINACDAMPEGGEAYFSTEGVSLSVMDCVRFGVDLQPGDYVRFSLTDFGEGIDKSIQSRIFEPFFTTKQARSRAGVGLAVAYNTVKNHGGSIDVESVLGQGTTFSVFLPLISDERLSASVSTPDQQIALSTKCALVVDDEEVARDVVIDMLEVFGFETHAFESPIASVEFYRQHWAALDIVLLDMVMPEMSGLEVFRELKKINPDVRVVLISGHSQLEEVEQALREGAKCFLKKPFTAEMLCDVVKQK